MKLSLNWIKDYIDLPEKLTLEKIAYDMTMATVEVEGWVDLNTRFDKMVIGVIKELNPHPNADKLTLCQVDIGGEIKEIVCGGSNLKNRMKVAVSLPGAMVKWHGEGDWIEITKAKVRGVESYGMICASSEIGLFDLFPFENEHTIMDMTGFEGEAGTPLAKVLGLDDTILEIDNKSLTNRPDLWGHYGIARELSALYNTPLKEIPSYTPPDTIVKNFSITIADEVRCPRYIGVEIDGVSVKPSPFEIQSRLWRVGLRPINALVDITNYVMLATGQPTHAFDHGQIAGHITVRTATEGEKLLLLDGRELTLTTEDLVIADDEGAVGLAGVMGGEKDSVLSHTTKIILEIANFEPKGIRRTASRHESRTESATRFEKGIDPERADITLSMAMKMLNELYPDMQITGFNDNYPTPLKRSRIEVSLAWLERRLGKKIPLGDISRMLGNMGFHVTFGGDGMKVSAPTWRSTGDITIADDIMEEIARMHGYENFEAAPIVTSFVSDINQLEVDIDRKVREYLATRCGMREVYTYPWIRTDFGIAFSLIGQDGESGLLALSAPPSPEEQYLRPSLLPNLCKAAVTNQHSFNEFAIFESAQVFLNRDFSSPYDPKEKLPLQRRHTAGAFFTKDSSLENVTDLFRKVKGVLETLPRHVHLEPFSFERLEKPAWSDETMWLNIIHCGETVGSLALLSARVAMDCGIKSSAIMMFELDIDALTPYPSRTNKYVPIGEYPVVDYDISLLFDLAVKWADIVEAVGDKDELLQGLSFIDEYKGKQIPEGKKSVTLRLSIGSREKTLESKEIENYANFVAKRLKKKLGAEARV